MGSIYRRKSDGRLVASLMVNGRRWSAYADSEDEAKELLAQLVLAAESGAPMSPRVRLGDYLRHWLSSVRPTVRPTTYEHYEVNCRVHIIPALGHVALCDLRSPAIEAFLAETPGSAQSKAHRRAILRRALTDAVRWHLLDRNEAALARAPKVERREIAPLSSSQADALLRELSGHRYHALYVLALHTGMRRGELLGLTWADIDLDAGELTIRRALQRIDRAFVLVPPKTRKRQGQRIPLTPAAVSALRAHRARQNTERLAAGAGGSYDGLIFTTPRGMPVHGADIDHVLTAALERAGLPRVRFHDLRHSAATILLSSGVHPRIVMELLGHSTITLTMNTYSHVSPTLLRGATDALAAALGGSGI